VRELRKSASAISGSVRRWQTRKSTSRSRRDSGSPRRRRRGPERPSRAAAGGLGISPTAALPRSRIAAVPAASRRADRPAGRHDASRAILPSCPGRAPSARRVLRSRGAGFGSCAGARSTRGCSHGQATAGAMTASTWVGRRLAAAQMRSPDTSTSTGGSVSSLVCEAVVDMGRLCIRCRANPGRCANGAAMGELYARCGRAPSVLCTEFSPWASPARSPPGNHAANCSGSGRVSPGTRSGKTRSARGSATERRNS
jgi:hypothetical protein